MPIHLGVNSAIPRSVHASSIFIIIALYYKNENSQLVGEGKTCWMGRVLAAADMSRLSLSLVPLLWNVPIPPAGATLPLVVAASMLLVAASAAGVSTRGEGGDPTPVSTG